MTIKLIFRNIYWMHNVHDCPIYQIPVCKIILECIIIDFDSFIVKFTGKKLNVTINLDFH